MPEQQPLFFMRTDDHSYSILIHQYGEKNQLVDILPCPAFGFLVGEHGPEMIVTMRGAVPIKDATIWAPDGCVHREGRIFHDYDTYMAWAKQGMQ